MDLEEAREFWERRAIFHDEYGVREVTDFLFGEVERLRGVMESCVAGHDDCCNFICNRIKAALAESPARSLPRARTLAQGWTACAESLPDADKTVMTYAPNSDEPVWPAYHDGERWMDVMGAPIDDAAITHWMEFPEPPQEVR